jgi:hypothetical protein
MFWSSLEVSATPADPHHPMSPTAAIVADPPDGGGGASAGGGGGGGGGVSAVLLVGTGETEGETGEFDPQVVTASAPTTAITLTSHPDRMINKGTRGPLQG